MHHSGQLVIEGDPDTGLVFRPAAEGLTAAIRRSLDQARALPVARTVEVAAARAPDSASAESGDELRGVRAALEKLGYSRSEARRRLEIVLGRREATGGTESPGAPGLIRECLRL